MTSRAFPLPAAAASRSPSHALARLWARLFAPVDIASLAVFRVAFGVIALWEMWRYYTYGWIEAFYINPSYYFTYFGFSWIQPWPGVGMELHFAALAVLAVCIALGLWYRLSAALFFFGFTYVFLLDQARYLNHFYLFSLISLLMIFIPANRTLSLDARRRPAIRSDTAPTWCLWLLLAQVGIVYFYGGVAKLNGDWLRGEPMRMWLAAETDFPLIGRSFTEEWVVYAMSYGGLLLDLLVVPLLLWRRTRPFAFAAALVFHLMNSQLFQIGIFPWFMIAATLLFFPPSWPRVGGFWRPARSPRVGKRRQRQQAAAAAAATPAGLSTGQRVTVALLGAYLAFQVLIPLRHHLYPGDVAWTEEGHRFSWRMKLRTKYGEAAYVVTDPASERRWEVDPDDELTNAQVEEMATRPDMVLQYAHHLARRWRADGYERVEVRAEVNAGLNGRPLRPLIDPEVDLAAQPRDIWPASWILPLDEPLPDRS